jgi:folate-binding protein YgfZ
MGTDDNRGMSNDFDTAAPFDGAVRLGDWGLIRARGADAASFLHSQLTQDIVKLGERQARLAGYCSAKGRLLATFVVWRGGPDELLLACSADLLAATLKRLSMYVLRAKCQLSDASAELVLFGLAGPSAARWLGASASEDVWSHHEIDGAQLTRLPDAGGQPRWLCAAPGPLMLPALAADAWNWLEVQSGVPRVTAATSEQFVPQMLNFELLGGVDFSKGCFPGQEVVARSQYRGTLKRRTYLMRSSEALTPGQEVFHSADPQQPAGMVVLAASLGGERHAALVEAKIAALADGELQAAGGARLSPAELPYPLASESA